MKLLFNKYLVFFFLILFTACSIKADTSKAGGGDLTTHILFIGNSHTYFNSGLDFHVKNFANSYSISADVMISANGGFTLENHLSNQVTLDLIESKNWNYIILQENTFRAVNEPDLMLESLQDFKTLLSGNPATVLLFKTWAYQDSPEMINALNTVYDDANLATGYSIVSIGTIWNNFIASESINLYADDGVHPNMQGTYLTSALFFKKLFSQNSIENSSYNATLTQEEADVIKNYVSNLAF